MPDHDAPRDDAAEHEDDEALDSEKIAETPPPNIGEGADDDA